MADYAPLKKQWLRPGSSTARRVAARVRERVAAEVEELAAPQASTPGLATILVGDDPASEVYVRMKRKACAEVGIASFHHELAGRRVRGRARRR